jgi:hypothetical protein
LPPGWRTGYNQRMETDQSDRLTVSHSELATWARCPRRWYFGTYLRWGTDPETAPATGTALLGTRLHLALEASEGHGIPSLEALSWVYDRASEEHPFEESDIRKERDLAFAILEGFLEWSAEEGYDVGYEVIATEKETHVDLPFIDWTQGDFTLVAKLDVLVRRTDDGVVRFRDYKSVGTLSKANGLLRDTQMRTYSMIQALQAKEDPSTPNPDGGQYVMLLRSKRTARAKGPFYQVVEFDYNRHDLNATWMRVRSIASGIADARRRLDAGEDHHMVAYPVPGDYCEWACPFNRICHLADDGSHLEEALQGNYVQLDPMARYSDRSIDLLLEALGGVGGNEQPDTDT